MFEIIRNKQIIKIDKFQKFKKMKLTSLISDFYELVKRRIYLVSKIIIQLKLSITDVLQLLHKLQVSYIREIPRILMISTSRSIFISYL